MTRQGRPHASRIGRLPRWQRRSLYGVLGLCAASGVGWFLLLDAWHRLPPQLTAWWIVHGLTGALSLVALGSVLPHHVVVAWKARRNRAAGACALGLFAAAALTALALLYGAEEWRDGVHVAHVALGLAVTAALPWHLWRGRRRARSD